MKKRYTDKELKEELNKICIVCDTREQENRNITEYFDKVNVMYETKKIDTADYSFKVDDTYFDDEIVIEKKRSLDEIAGNFTADRQRFENEFLRAKAHGIKVFLLIENATFKDIENHNYISKLNPKALMASLLSWQVKYNITINFCDPADSGKIIYGTFYYWLKNKLENG